MIRDSLPGAPDALVDALGDEATAALIALRRDLHQHPELSYREHRTAERLERALREAGIADVRRVAGTGVVARVPGREPGAPAVAIRGDIDALPIEERTGLPYASVNAGVMHACGHDVHATWAVGAAMLLAREPARGDVVIVLQPAEEAGDGARAMIDAGALDGVAAIFGAHVDRRFEVGQVVADAGGLAAAADTFTIELVGRGAHAARPHEARDPIVAAAAVVTAIQSIVSRRLDPASPAVVTVGRIAAGTAANVIPETAELEGTIRTLDPGVRDAVHGALREVAASVASAHGVRAEVRITLGPPPVVNREPAIGWARAAATSVVGPGGVVPFGVTNMAAEDFAHYLERVPGAFLRIGAREPGGSVIAAHQPTFHAAEGSIVVGAAVLAACARVACDALAASASRTDTA